MNKNSKDLKNFVSSLTVTDVMIFNSQLIDGISVVFLRLKFFETIVGYCENYDISFSVEGEPFEAT